jgi:glucose-1-phosphate cytidylyltransferase
MKVVLFCGGLGMRLREYAENIPKPMVPIGNHPILWQLMKYYAHYGHNEFILCLGHNGTHIKQFFLDHDELLSNDFVLHGSGERELIQTDLNNWKIVFADTGQNSNIGVRLKKAERYLEDDDIFLANYADGLCDLPLPSMIDFFQKSGKAACFVCVRPTQSFHYVRLNQDGTVDSIQDTRETGLSVNGGFFIFKRRVFDYMEEGEELVHEPFARMIENNDLLAYQYDGFWKCMDTFKDKQEFDSMYDSGDCPWEVWRN